MHDIDEKDINEMQALLQMHSEMEALKKPWRWILEYGFFGFKVDTISFKLSLFMCFAYIYIQRIGF